MWLDMALTYIFCNMVKGLDIGYSTVSCKSILVIKLFHINLALMSHCVKTDFFLNKQLKQFKLHEKLFALNKYLCFLSVVPFTVCNNLLYSVLRNQ